MTLGRGKAVERCVGLQGRVLRPGEERGVQALYPAYRLELALRHEADIRPLCFVPFRVRLRVPSHLQPVEAGERFTGRAAEEQERAEREVVLIEVDPHDAARRLVRQRHVDLLTPGR